MPPSDADNGPVATPPPPPPDPPDGAGRSSGDDALPRLDGDTGRRDARAAADAITRVLAGGRPDTPDTRQRTRNEVLSDVMGWLDRIDAEEVPPAPLPLPHSEVEVEADRPYLILLADRAADVAPTGWTARLQAFDPVLAAVRIEGLPGADPTAVPYAWLHFGPHIVEVVAASEPIPRELLARCTEGRGLDDTTLARAHGHQAHLLAYYDGPETTPPLDKYRAIAMVVAALATDGAQVVLNEPGRVATRVGVLIEPPGRDARTRGERLHRLSPLALWAGIQRLTEATPGKLARDPDTPRTWLRTHGGPLLGLPDVAIPAPTHDTRAALTFLDDLLGYTLRSGHTIVQGDTLDTAAGGQLTVRAPRPDEAFLGAPRRLLVLDPGLPPQ